MKMYSDNNMISKRFAFKTGDGPELPGLHVVRFEGRERYSELFEFRIVLAASDMAAMEAMDDALNKSATLSLFPANGGDKREFHGIPRHVRQLHRRNDLTYYEVTLVPHLWLMGETRGSYVFVDKSFKDILEIVLNRAVPGRYKLHLTSDYKPRDLVLQYNESALDFIHRWMEFYGIYYYFDHASGHDEPVFTDATDTLGKMNYGKGVMNHDDGDDDGVLYYDPVNGLQSGDADRKIQNFTVEKHRLPATVRLRNYSSDRPDLDLVAEAAVSARGSGDVSLYGQSFSTIEDGSELARIRAEEIICRGEVYRGDATTPFLCVGQYFTLRDHYRTSLNADYQVTAVNHHGNQSQFLQESGLPVDHNATMPGGGYHCDFEAIARRTPFRPRRKTPVPVLPSKITGHIDGVQDGKYAELDGEGRYKVRLLLDDGDPEKKPGKASCWLRMAQPYGGPDRRGIHFPLVKGTEVLLTAIDGDLDRLIIQSVVPNPGPVNAENQTQNVIRTAGGNVIKLEDEKGGQGVHIFSPTGDSYLSIGASMNSYEETDSKVGVENNEKPLSEISDETSSVVTEQGIGEKTEHNKTSIIDGYKLTHVGKNNTSHIHGNDKKTIHGYSHKWTYGSSFSCITGGKFDTANESHGIYTVKSGNIGLKIDTVASSIKFSVADFQFSFAKSTMFQLQNTYASVKNDIIYLKKEFNSEKNTVNFDELSTIFKKRGFININTEMTNISFLLATTEYKMSRICNRITDIMSFL